MSENCGYVVKVTELREHSNADNLQIATFFGNNTCVDLSVKEGDIGIYFPSDLQLSEKFCKVNHLIREKDSNGKNIGGYLDADKRNIRPIKLRGEKSDGIYLPITCLSEFGDVRTLIVGDKICAFNGEYICRKYIPKKPPTVYVRKKYNTNKKTVIVSPLFKEHVDTEQLVYHMDDFNIGDEIEITLKMHGTSQRTAYLPVLTHYKRTFFDKLLRRQGEPIYDWNYITGTRRTILSNDSVSYYGSDNFRKDIAEFFVGKLHKGEEIYYEVVGYSDNGKPIMPDGDNRKIHDKEFIIKYGNTTKFSYGCEPDGELKTDFYVYRMTSTNEDGDIVEYSPDFTRYRCEQMGCKFVPVFVKFTITPNIIATPGDVVKSVCERFYDGEDPIGKTHIREGVVARIINKPTFTAYKHKNFYFKALEGIIKDEAVEPDMEESQEINEV